MMQSRSRAAQLSTVCMCDEILTLFCSSRFYGFLFLKNNDGFVLLYHTRFYAFHYLLFLFERSLSSLLKNISVYICVLCVVFVIVPTLLCFKKCNGNEIYAICRIRFKSMWPLLF
jgi:hypothetical protein